MPLLSKRASLLDIFTSSSNDGPRPMPPRPHTGDVTAEPESLPPRPRSEHGLPRSSLSREVWPEDIPESKQQGNDRPKRFSMLKMRNFSESHLSTRAKEEAMREMIPPVPSVPTDSTVPAILRTAPTFHAGGEMTDNEDEEDAEGEATEPERKPRPSLFKRSMSKQSQSDKRKPRKSTDEKRIEKPKPSSLRWRKLQGRSTGLEDLQRLSAMHIAQTQGGPPSYGDDSNSALALPVLGPRFSQSSRSDGSNDSSEQVYGSTTTTTHTVSTQTTFFKLPRRNKNRNSLFPLPIKLPPPQEDLHQRHEPTTPRASTSAMSTKSAQVQVGGREPPVTMQRRHTETSPTKLRDPGAPLLPPAALAGSSLSFAEPGMNLFRNTSRRSRSSSNSSPLQPPALLGMRERSSTTSSFGRSSHDPGTPPTLTGSGRNSVSTTGRSSLGGFLNLSRFRQGSDPHSPRHGSPGRNSKSDSFAISREALVVPEREEGDTPGKYLERLEAAVARSVIATILSKSADPFAQAVLRSYMRRFSFFGEPIDMSLRKLLLEAELPKETQQVDRVIQAFADRYHECNPGIFVAPDQAYIIAFSLMMLHTDAFNKNNKRKMQKHHYIKNTSGQDVSDDVLGCFYDNICYTPFVHYEEEVDINGERVLPFKPKKSKLKGAIADSGKKPSGPVDPYNLLVDQKLDMLRPPIKESITMDDPYHYRGGLGELDPDYLQRAFTHTGVLQIISQRSRPSAYEAQLTNSAPNPQDMQVGIIDIKITKVGVLWRKAAKKKKARSPWQEWGAILTGSQLYLFKNVHWAKGLMHQFLGAQKHGQPRIPVIFRPPLQEFKPDALIKTDNAVALVDNTYTRHKHAFTLVRPGGQEEVLLADNEGELNDWLALINYAAAFRSAGVRIRGMVGGTEEDLRARDVHRLDSTSSARSAQTTGGELAVQRGGLSPQLRRQVMTARRQIMIQKIREAKKEINDANKELDHMLRNARHLLVLAPVAPKSREDIMHAAAQADAVIKWTRRDIWRMRCHKDILIMDVQQDGVSASEIAALADQEAVETPESSRRPRARDPLRLESNASASRSPPGSPTTPSQYGRPSVSDTLESYADDDVFATPRESFTITLESEGFRIPAYQLEVLRQEDEERRRRSIASTLFSAQSTGDASLSHTTSASSVRPFKRKGSDVPSDPPRGRSTPTPSVSDHDIQVMARTTIPPDRIDVTPARSALDGSGHFSTPESRHKTVRRSLQRTLRDAHHHQHSTSSAHRHRRNKESDSTIRSGGEAEGSTSSHTPALTREKGGFILHGKKASVVQFGSDWPNERMKLRREAWQRNDPVRSPSDPEGTPRAQIVYEREYSAPVLQGGRKGSTTSEGGLASPRRNSSYAHESLQGEDYASFSRRESETTVSETASEPIAGFDLSSWNPQKGKRDTVIGPRPEAPQSVEMESSDEGEEDVHLAAKANRQTVIGPAKTSVPTAGTETPSAEVGAEEEAELAGETVERKKERVREAGHVVHDEEEDLEFRRLRFKPVSVR